MSRPNLLSREELHALIQANPRHGGTVFLFGRQIPWAPVSVGGYCRDVLARFESAQAIYVQGALQAAAQAEIERAKAEGREPDADIVNAPNVVDYTTAQAKDGWAANCAFIASGIGAGSDPVMEDAISAEPVERVFNALETIEEGSWGDDPEGFFGAAGKTAAGRAAMALAKARAKKTAGASSSSATTGKIPTPSTARTANRKDRRTTAAKARATRG